MTRDQHQARIDRISWYHELELEDLSVRSQEPDVEQHRVIWSFIEEQLEQIDFRDRTVLDVGCWDGKWSFYAERRGARSVLATDDITQNWSTGDGLLLARELSGSAIEVDQHRSIYELTALQRRFDIVLCLGVYYHLLDPTYAFAQLRHCCHSNTILVLEGDVAIGIPPGEALHSFGDSCLPAFLPSAALLEKLLGSCYLRVVRQAWIGPHGRLRSLLARLRHGRAVSRRVVTVCEPFAGANELHPYPPPFDLARYDSRFSSSD